MPATATFVEPNAIQLVTGTARIVGRPPRRTDFSCPTPMIRARSSPAATYLGIGHPERHHSEQKIAESGCPNQSKILSAKIPWVLWIITS